MIFFKTTAINGNIKGKIHIDCQNILYNIQESQESLETSYFL